MHYTGAVAPEQVCDTRNVYKEQTQVATCMVVVQCILTATVTTVAVVLCGPQDTRKEVTTSDRRNGWYHLTARLDDHSLF